MKSKMGNGMMDLEKHFALYGAYHRNPTNIFIHGIFVWPIFFNSLVLFHFTPPLFRLPFLGSFAANIALVAVLLYSLLCIALDKKSGSLAAFLCLLCWFGSHFLAARLGFSLAWKVVLVSLFLCSMGQSLGHFVFEKRVPSLLDNLSEAFLLAPFFVLLEVLVSSFGYEPYPGFRARVDAKIEADRKEWQANKKTKYNDEICLF